MKYSAYLRSLMAAAPVVIFAGCSTLAPLDQPSASALQAMSDTLTAADQLAVSATRKLDRQLVDNPAVIRDAVIAAQIDRPDRAHVVVRGDGEERHLYLGKGGSAISSPGKGVYALFGGHPSIEESCDAAAKHLGILIPAQDFLSSNPYRDFRAGSDSIEHRGVERLAGTACDHLQGTREDLTWELWIAQSDHLPRRFTITMSALEGEDHLVLDFTDWDLSPSIRPGTFDFTPPEGAREIDIVVPAQ